MRRSIVPARVPSFDRGGHGTSPAEPGAASPGSSAAEGDWAADHRARRLEKQPHGSKPAPPSSWVEELHFRAVEHARHTDRIHRSRLLMVPLMVTTRPCRRTAGGHPEPYQPSWLLTSSGPGHRAVVFDPASITGGLLPGSADGIDGGVTSSALSRGQRKPSSTWRQSRFARVQPGRGGPRPDQRDGVGRDAVVRTAPTGAAHPRPGGLAADP
jgi:hypothetical protein